MVDGCSGPWRPPADACPADRAPPALPQPSPSSACRLVEPVRARLRETTREDALTYLKTRDGHHRRDQLVPLRRPFAWAKRNGLIFRSPTSRIKAGRYEHGVPRPLVPEHIDHAVAAVTTPAARPILALAAVHAVRVAQIGTLMLDDVDLDNRHLTRANVFDLSEPASADQQSDRDAERAGRQPLDQHGPSRTGSDDRNGSESTPARRSSSPRTCPTPLAEVFGLDEKAAMRDANSGRALLQGAAEQQ